MWCLGLGLGVVKSVRIFWNRTVVSMFVGLGWSYIGIRTAGPGFGVRIFGVRL